MSHTIKKFELSLTYDNYIVRDHRVHEMRVLPGVTLIDIIYRTIGKDYPDKNIVLRNILFKEPIVVTDKFDQTILVTLYEQDEHKHILIESQQSKDQLPLPESLLKTNAECDLDFEEKQNIENTFDVNAFIARATHHIDMNDIYAYTKQLGIEHFEFMRAIGKIYHQSDAVLMVLSLGELARTYLNQFYIHPTFLDASTFAGLVSSDIVKGNDEQIIIDKPYIPFFIKSFKLGVPVTDPCYVLIKKNKSLTLSDLIKNDIDVFTQEGKLVYQMKELTTKKIRTSELITDLGAPQKKVKENVPLAQDKKSQGVQSKNRAPQKTIELILSEMIAIKLNQEVESIDPTSGFYDMGLDSRQLLQLVQDLETLAFHEHDGPGQYNCHKLN